MYGPGHTNYKFLDHEMFLTLHKLFRAGCCGAIAYLILSGCAPKKPYTDVPYTPTGKVHFDSMDSRASARSNQSAPPATSTSTVKQQPSANPSDSTALSTVEKGPAIPSEADAASPSAAVSEPKSKCQGDQSSILTLKTESYDVTICDDNGNFRYYGTYLPSDSETELPALLSDSGYYVKDGGYEYWVTPRSMAIYKGKELLQEEFAQ